jgi:formylglycine-generating enzyme required for sulfatase activity
MMRPRAVAAAIGVSIAALVGVALVVVKARGPAARCGPGFAARGARCCTSASAGPCAAEARPPAVVAVPQTTFTVGPSDWEAEGRVRSRTVTVPPFAIEALEVTVGRAHCATCALPRPALVASGDLGRAAAGLSAAEARAICAHLGGRLPTEDEWVAAATGAAGTRYPWGDTGAVCRRAAWGLLHGPCGEGAEGPDTAGAHPDGATPSGIDDLAGNVAEWVETPQGPVAKGGSWATPLAADLRIWARLEVEPTAHDPRVGVRCVRPQAP